MYVSYLGCMVSVSYTHLDVYKRQVLGGGMILSLTIKIKGGLVPETDARNMVPSSAPSHDAGLEPKSATIGGSGNTTRSNVTNESQPLEAVNNA